MREIRKSGSEGGGAHKLSLPLSQSGTRSTPFAIVTSRRRTYAEGFGFRKG
jgi:hypothetical protein